MGLRCAFDRSHERRREVPSVSGSGGGSDLHQSRYLLFVAFDPDSLGCPRGRRVLLGSFPVEQRRRELVPAQRSLYAWRVGESLISPGPFFSHFDHDKPRTILVYLGTLAEGCGGSTLAENDISVTKNLGISAPTRIVHLTAARRSPTRSASATTALARAGPSLSPTSCPRMSSSSRSHQRPDGLALFRRRQRGDRDVHAVAVAGRVRPRLFARRKGGILRVGGRRVITNTRSWFRRSRLDALQQHASATIQASNPSPVIHALSAVPSILTPPNHKMRPVIAPSGRDRQLRRAYLLSSRRSQAASRSKDGRRLHITRLGDHRRT